MNSIISKMSLTYYLLILKNGMYHETRAFKYVLISATCMIGSVKGVVSLVQRGNSNVVQTHCFLHRKALVSKTIPDELNQVLKQVVKMGNFIKTRPLKSCLFGKIFVDMDSQHKRLILHTEAR